MAAPAVASTTGATVALPPPVAATTSAPNTPEPPAPIDPISLGLAHQIVDIALPPASRMDILDRLEAGLMKGLRQGFDNAPGMHDAGYKAIFDDYLSQSAVMSHKVMADLLPEMTDVMAQAYARTFSHDDLAQVLAFAKTPAGERYLQRSSSVMQDPLMQAFMGRLMQTLMQEQQTGAKALKNRLTAYLKAHSKLAVEIGKASGQ